MKNKVIVAAVALLAVFLLGYVPPYLKANRLESELHQFRQDASGADLRDLAALAYVQANQKNYGLAAEVCGRFFNRVREVANQTTDASRRKALEELLVPRDRVTAALAKGDSVVTGDLLDLFNRTRLATTSSTAP